MPRQRQMTLIAFLNAQNRANYVGSWRHPASMSDFLTPEYYQRIARTLEDGRFQMAFFDDRLAMSDIYGNDHRATVENGIRAVKLDPTVIMMAMAAATSRLGLGATYSTTYYEPFHVARLFDAAIEKFGAMDGAGRHFARQRDRVPARVKTADALGGGRKTHTPILRSRPCCSRLRHCRLRWPPGAY